MRKVQLLGFFSGAPARSGRSAAGLLGPGNILYRDSGTDCQPGGRRQPDEHLNDRLPGTFRTARNLTRLFKGLSRFAPWCVEHGRTALLGVGGTLGRGTFHNGTLRRRDHKVTPDATCRTGPGPISERTFA